MSADDVLVGIDGSGAKKGADEVVRQLERIETAAGSMSKRAGNRIQALYDKIQKLAGVTAPSASKIQALHSLSNAVASLGSAKGPNASTVRNLSAFAKAINGLRIPSNLGGFSTLTRALSGFRGPTKPSVANVRELFSALSRLPGTAGLSRMLADLRLITARLAPVAAALTRLQGAGGAAAGGLRRAGQAARSAHADFIGLRASSLSLGGALLRTGEFASALGAAFGLRSVANEINVMQKTEATLMAVTGSLAQSRKEMEFLMDTAREYRVYVGDLSQGYSQFRVASSGLGLSLRETQQLFTDITQGVRVFNLSTEDAEGVFRALTQIASKGSLQMEELRGQLGDRMPVAVQAMANALGVTTAKLGEMMKKGEVTGNVLKRGMVGFGAEIRRMTDAGLVRSTQTLGASLADLKTTFYEFANGLGQAGLTEFFQNVASGLNDLITAGSPANNVLKLLGGTLAFVSRNFYALAGAIAILFLPKLIASFVTLTGVMRASTMALVANRVATTTAATANGGMVASLAILGEYRSLTTSATNLNTAAQAGNIAATYAGIRANGLFATSMAVVRGGLRALWLTMLAHPITAIAIALAALVGVFLWLKDATDVTRRSQELYSEAVEQASNSSLATQSSIASLTAEYYGLAAAATAAGLAVQESNTLQRLESARTTRDRAVSDATSMSRAAGVRIDLSSPEGIAASIAATTRRQEQLGPASTGMDALMHGNPREAVDNLASSLRTLQVAEETARRERLALDTTRESMRLRNSGVTGGALGGGIAGYAQVRSRQLGLDIPLTESAPTQAIIDTEDKKKKRGKSDAEREMERRTRAAESLVSRLDAVYDATNTLKESMESLSYVQDAAFGSSTVEKVELVRRAINDAFQEVGKFDVVSNLTAEWSDSLRMVDSYRKALEDADVPAGDLVERASALARLEYVSNYSDALGPLGSMVDLVSQTERKIEQMKTVSHNLQLSEESRALMAETIADEYGRAAREIVNSTRAGKLLTAEFENALKVAEDFAGIMSDAFGAASADGLLLSINRTRRAAEGLNSVLPSLSVKSPGVGGGSAMGGVSSTDLSGEETAVNEIAVMGSRSTQAAFFQTGVDTGIQFMNGLKNAVAQNKLGAEQIIDSGRLRVFGLIADLMGQGGALGDMQNYNEAIQQVQTSIANFSGSAETLRQLQYVQESLTYSVEQMRASYYEAALEATKTGHVINTAFDSANTVLQDFITTGTADIGAFFRGIQADLLQTFVLTPLINKGKEMIAGMLGVADPTAKGADGQLQAATVINTAAGTLDLAADKIAQAAYADQQRQTMQDAMMTQMGIHIDRFGQIVGAMPGAGAIAGAGGGLTTPEMPAGVVPGAVPGQTTGAVNGAAVQPSQQVAATLTPVADSLTQAGTQGITAALGLQGVSAQMAATIIPGLLQSIFGTLFGAEATAGAAVATGTAATQTMTAGFSLVGAASALSSAAVALITAAQFETTMAAIPGFHAGGIAGGRATFTRAMSPASFAGAPRYHKGGLAGFKPGEIPAVLKKKEEILTEDNPRHIENFYQDRGFRSGSNGASVYSNEVQQTNEINISIVGSAGTPEQNQDLAQRTAREMAKALDMKTRSTIDKKSRNPGMKVR